MISIITPVYNGERFIEFCIKSVIEQNCTDVEHIIVDGGSTDGTVEIIKSYAEKYPHIRWVSEKDKGQSDAMNKGFKMSRGDIIAYLNADDFFEQSAFYRIISYFEANPDISFVVGKLRVVENDTSYWINDPKTTFKDMLYWWEPNAYAYNSSAYFYKREVQVKVGEFNVQQHHSMDWEFLMKASTICKFGKINYVIGNFILHEETKTYKSKGVDNLKKKFSSAEKYAESLSLKEQKEFIKRQNKHFKKEQHRRENYLLKRIYSCLFR